MSPQPEIVIAIVMAVIPFLAVGSLLWVSQRLGQRRAASISRQVGLTDAIHRELGAAAAPMVRQAWLGGWTVSMAVLLERGDTVAAVVRIAHQFFSKLDGVAAPRLRIVLRSPEPRPAPGEPTSARQTAMSSAASRAAGNLTRAGARLG